MKVLVTGGAGYIGSVCVEELIKAGHEVDIIDNLSEGFREAVVPKRGFTRLLEPKSLGAGSRRRREARGCHPFCCARKSRRVDGGAGEILHQQCFMGPSLARCLCSPSGAENRLQFDLRNLWHASIHAHG